MNFDATSGRIPWRFNKEAKEKRGESVAVFQVEGEARQFVLHFKKPEDMECQLPEVIELLLAVSGAYRRIFVLDAQLRQWREAVKPLAEASKKEAEREAVRRRGEWPK